MKTPQLDVFFFKPFVDGTLHALKIQCSIEAKTGKPFRKGDRKMPSIGITGVIGLTSAVFTGSITICFPAAVFLDIMGKMLGETFTEITPDLQDGAAELLNMIFGQAKVVLNEKGYQIQKAIPNVILGDNIQTAHLTSRPVIVIPFMAPAGEFFIEISLEGDSIG